MSTVEHLRCIELVELVTDYLEGALPDDVRARFEAHLAGCDGCTTYVEQIRRTIAMCGRMDVGDLDPAARAALLHAFRGWAGD
jgi:anti-sigma factor RsiW